MPQDAKSILESLAEGVDPFTGEVLPTQSPYNHPEVIRALYKAIRALDGVTGVAANIPNTETNRGKKWSDTEEQQMLDALRSGEKISEIARRLSRPESGVFARLVRLGVYEDTTIVLEPQFNAKRKERPWTAQEDTGLKEAFLSGNTIQDMCYMFERLPRQIAARLAEIGCTKPKL